VTKKILQDEKNKIFVELCYGFDIDVTFLTRISNAHDDSSMQNHENYLCLLVPYDISSDPGVNGGLGREFPLAK